MYEHIPNIEVHNLLIFIGAAILGTLFAYTKKWAWSEGTNTLKNYLFQDSKAFGRVATTLGVLCAGTGGLEYLENMTDIQIVIAGMTIGFLVPSAVELKEINNEKQLAK